MDIQYSSSLVDVDWHGLQTALAEDRFDNGRTPEEYRLSHQNSHAVILVSADGTYVGNGRILSDGVGNAWLVDIWTATPFRRKGIGSEIVRRLLATVPGQHVALFTEHRVDFYRSLGFDIEREGMSMVVGSWLGR